LNHYGMLLAAVKKRPAYTAEAAAMKASERKEK
jgi:hypothetical protein